MRRLVLAAPLNVGKETVLDAAQVHYLFDVLRMREGEEFFGLDAGGRSFVLKLLPRPAARCLVLSEAAASSHEPLLKITQYLPLLKGDKLDWVVQKSVELGTTEIVFFAAQRSIVKWTDNIDKKFTRLEKIAMEATQQCGRNLVPALRGVLTLEEAAREGTGIFAWEGERQESLKSYLRSRPSPTSLAVLSGPEGGLSPDEVSLLTGLGWSSISLGSRILRAETAAIAVLACTMYSYGEMG